MTEMVDIHVEYTATDMLRSIGKQSGESVESVSV